MTTQNEPKQGYARLVTAEEAEKYWQPVPANGHATVSIAPHMVRMDGKFAVGTQTLPPGGRVRGHSHADNEEVLYFMSGSGSAVVNGETLAIKPGSALFLGKNAEHTFTNDGDTDLSWVWVFTPNGLESFFRDIGRVRVEGETAPEPFARPANIAEIERNSVFAVVRS